MKEIKVVCGAVVIKDNKFVMVKEAQEYCYGEWNLPTGHLDLDEDILRGAIREVKEETNLDIKLEGLIGIYEHRSRKGHNVVKFMFKASVIDGELKYQERELLDAKWFSFEEFEKLKDSEIRNKDIRKIIADVKKGKLIDLKNINLSM